MPAGPSPRSPISEPRAPQCTGPSRGGGTRPLCNLHYCFDLWAERWRRQEARGDMIVVRYADDLVVGFEHEGDARRFLDAMHDRLGEFALSLHPDKTRMPDAYWVALLR